MTTHVLTIWVLAAASVQLGTLWIMKMSILPMLNALPYGRYVDTCQLIDMRVFHPIAVWNGIIAAFIGVYLAIFSATGWVSVLFLIGSLGMTIVGVTSEGWNRPIWRQIEKWVPAHTADEWAEKRYRWHLAHQIRTYGAILAVAGYVAAAITV